MTPLIVPTHDVLKQLLDYWQKKKGARIAPSRSDIDPAEIKALLPYVGLADVLRDPLRFRYRLVGTQVTMGYGRELTGSYLNEVDLNAHQHEIIDEYKRVVERCEPACASWEYTRHDGRHIRYERLALPLSSDGKTVDMLFGGAVFEKAYG
jgi:hypothetical protein